MGERNRVLLVFWNGVLWIERGRNGASLKVAVSMAAGLAIKLFSLASSMY